MLFPQPTHQLIIGAGCILYYSEVIAPRAASRPSGHNAPMSVPTAGGKLSPASPQPRWLFMVVAAKNEGVECQKWWVTSHDLWWPAGSIVPAVTGRRFHSLLAKPGWGCVAVQGDYRGLRCGPFSYEFRVISKSVAKNIYFDQNWCWEHRLTYHQRCLELKHR